MSSCPRQGDLYMLERAEREVAVEDCCNNEGVPLSVLERCFDKRDRTLSAARTSSMVNDVFRKICALVRR